MRSRWRYLDGWLILFMALAALASLIASHGSRVFFGYLVDAWLAWVFTAVLAIGIVGLDAAATLEPIWWKRWMYLAGMLLFLAMETLGNYFAGQAVFVARVRAALAGSPDSDLLTIATTSPGASRGLVVLFLALASVAVAFFTFAAATRAKQLAQPRSVSRRVRQLRALARRLARSLRSARAESAQAQANLAQAQATAAHQQTVTAHQEAELAQLRAALDTAQRQAAQQAEAYAAGLRRQEAEIARLRDAAAQPPDPDQVDLLAIARVLRDRGLSSRETASLLRMPEATMRGKLKSTNGVHAPD